MNNRMLGILLTVTALTHTLNMGIRYAVDRPETYEMDAWAHLTAILFFIGAIAGLVGLLRLEALGQKTLVRAVAFVPIIGLVALIVSALLWFTNSPRSVVELVESIGALLFLAGIVLVGIFTIAAQTWRGWRRLTPLLTVLAIPIGLGIATVVGRPTLAENIALVAWAFLGVVIATAESTPALSPRAAT